MSVHRFLFLGLATAFILAPLLQAQESAWQNLAEIRPGAKIQVVENSLKSTSGKFVGFSDTDLTLKVDEREIVIAKNQVHRVTVNGKNRKRNILIGLAVGAGAGAAVGAATRSVVKETWVVPGMMLAYAGVGAGVGAVLPAAKTVYTAEASKQASSADPVTQEAPK